MKTIDKTTLTFSIGAGCYWSSSLLATISWKDSYSVASGQIHQLIPLTIILFLVIIAYAFADRFQHRTWQTSLALLGLISFFVKSALLLINGLDTPFFFWLFLAMEGCQTASFILFWGLGFASLDKSAAEKTVFLSLIFCFVIYLALSLLPASRFAIITANALKALGTIPILISGIQFPVRDRKPVERNYPLLSSVLLSRVFFGIASGIAMALSAFCASLDSPASPILCSIFLIVLALSSLYLLKRKAPDAGLLRVSPFLIGGILVLPYLGSGQEANAIAHSSYMVVWLSWLVLSSIQISDLKDKIGWNEARITFLEKVVYVGSWVISWALTYMVTNLFSVVDMQHASSYVLPVVSYTTIVVACLLLSNLIDGKIWTSTISKASALVEKQTELIYERIAKQYRLTNQEKTIMILTAKGHKRPYICKKLVLAESTVKSHAKHLYQKLGIHSRDELLQLIENQKEELEAPTF